MISKPVLGIDIGGTNTSFGLVDENGKVLFRDSVSTKSAKVPEQLVDLVYNNIQSYCLLNKIEIRAVGIGAPNGNFYNGTIEFAPNLEWKGVIPLAYLFQRKFKVKSVLTNDANAAALGEMLFGAARGMKDFIFITLGTGVGSGIVVNGKVVYGHGGFAGEIGHVIIDVNGRECGCGRKGCLETYCSGRGILKTYNEISNDYTIKNSKEVAELAIAGNENALKTFTVTAKILAMALANSVAYTEPQAIFIFGGPSNAGELLFKPVREMFEENLLRIYKNKIPICESGLPENDAAILGAASLVME